MLDMDSEKLLEEFKKEMILKGYSENTINSYSYTIQKLLNFLNGKKLTEEGVRDFLFDLRESCSNNTLFTYSCQIKAFLFFCQKDFEIPFPKIEKKLPTFLTRGEIQKLFESIDNKRDYLIIRILYATGMRVSELVELEWGNIEGNTIKIYGKGKKERIVYVDDETLKLLPPKKKKGRIFNISVRQVEKIVKKWAKKAGIEKNVTPHTLRHTFATHLLENQANIIVIKDLLGHASLNTTQIYTHVTDEHRKRDYGRHPLAAGDTFAR